LHSAEWAHAVAQQVFWGAMSAADAQQVYRDVANDLAAGLWVEIELPEKSFDLCADLARVTAQNSAFTPSTACTSPALSNSKLNDFGPSMIARRSWQRPGGTDHTANLGKVRMENGPPHARQLVRFSTDYPEYSFGLRLYRST
jgi:hypothetical protein